MPLTNDDMTSDPIHCHRPWILLCLGPYAVSSHVIFYFLGYIFLICSQGKIALRSSHSHEERHKSPALVKTGGWTGRRSWKRKATSDDGTKQRRGPFGTTLPRGCGRWGRTAWSWVPRGGVLVSRCSRPVRHIRRSDVNTGESLGSIRDGPVCLVSGQK